MRSGKHTIDKAGADLGRRGGKAAAAKRTAAERSELARKAANARWSKRKTVSGNDTS